MATDPTSLKKLKDPNDASNYVRVPVRDSILIYDPKNNSQVYVYRIDNSENARRDVHVKTVQNSQGDGSTIDVERIETWWMLDPKSNAQLTGVRLANFDPPPMTKDMQVGDSPKHLLVHYVRITGDNDPNGYPRVTIERIDALAIKDPKDNGQVKIVRIAWPAIGAPLNDAADPFNATHEVVNFASLPAAPEGSNVIDPPYRLDPFQNIVDVSWGGAAFITASGNLSSGNKYAYAWKTSGDALWSYGENELCAYAPCALDASFNGYVIKGNRAAIAPLYLQQLKYDAIHNVVTEGWSYNLGDAVSGFGFASRLYINSINCDSDGNVIVVTTLEDFSGPGSVTESKLYKISPLGVLLWQKTFSGISSSGAVDGSGNVYVCQPGQAQHQLMLDTNNTGTLLAFDSNGVASWTKSLTTSGSISARGGRVATCGTGPGGGVAVYDAVASTHLQLWHADMPDAESTPNQVDIDGAGNVFLSTYTVNEGSSDPHRGNLVKWDKLGALQWNTLVGNEAVTFGAVSQSNGGAACVYLKNYTVKITITEIDDGFGGTIEQVDYRTTWDNLASVFKPAVGFSFNYGQSIQDTATLEQVSRDVQAIGRTP